MARDFNLFKQEIKDQKVAVIGLGVSNIPLVRFLLKLGAKVTAFDKRPMEELDQAVRAFEGQAEFVLGENYLDDLTGYPVIFRTPGMRPDVPALEKARSEGSVVTSEMREFMRHCPGKMIGITGSDGKSTTTTMVHGLLQAQGHKSRIGGNIGFPLFDEIETIEEDEYIVLELSNFQLMDLGVSPEIAVVTNLSPNHLDIHKDMEEYRQAKINIFRFQKETDTLIINLDNEYTREFRQLAKGSVKGFSSKQKADAYYADGTIFLRDQAVVDLADMKLKGIHNAENLCTALLATEGLVELETARRFALEFAGVKHRAQFIAKKREVRYYNDSIASSPTRTLATIRSFGDDWGRINIILGGVDKNLDYSELAEEGKSYFRNIILVGAAKEKIRRAFIASGGDAAERLIDADNFEEAVELIAKVSIPGDVAILSPACASFDMFRNFEKRGERFEELVLAMD